jgi:sodium-dependent phosphate cotransporter
MLMKTGARGLEPLVKDWLHVEGVANAVGFGWLFAYAVMSGSPVAASSLALLDQHVLTPLEAYGMISGSRLGASFIVLLIGFLYALRGHERRTSLSAGILSLCVTGTLQASAIVMGVAILSRGLIPPIYLGGGALISSVTDRMVGSLASAVAVRADALGGPALVFLTGLGVILASFSLFDRGLPPLRLEGTAMGDISRLLYRPVVMFVLGMVVTILSMSVSLSLSLLVPLSARGYVRRENLIPYIMGANITTFIDTLLAAMLLGNPVAVSVVVTQMLAATVTSALILLLMLRPYEQVMLRTASWVTADNRALAIFFVIIFAIPIALLVL